MSRMRAGGRHARRGLRYSATARGGSSLRLKHVAIHVPDLAEAEAFYTTVLRMEVVTRESAGDDGVWRQAPAGLGWEEVRGAGRDLHMIALRRGDLVVALFTGQPRPGTVYLVGIVADAEEIAEVRENLPDGTVIETDEADALTFVDPCGFRWQLSGPAFLGAGDARGDWLDLQD